MKIIIPKQKTEENFNNFLQEIYTSIRQKEFDIANTIVFFQTLTSNEYSSYWKELLDFKDGITFSSYYMRILEESNIYYKGKKLVGNYFIHTPIFSEGRKILITTEGLEAKIIGETSIEEYEGYFNIMPEELLLHLTGTKNKEKLKRIKEKVVEMIGSLYVNLKPTILDPLNPEVVPITLIPKIGREETTLTNSYSQKTLFNLRYLKVEYK